MILHSNVFKNEKSRWVAEGSQEAMMDNVNPERTIRDFQLTLNGLMRFQEILEGIEDPSKKVEEILSPFSGI
jgi:hypothetical protein